MMKKAKTLVRTGSILRLIGGIAMLVAVIALLINSKIKGETISNDLLAPIIGFSIMGIASLISSIVDLTLAKHLDDRTSAIIVMIFGILSLPIGLFDFFGGKIALDEEAKRIKELYGEEADAIIKRRNSITKGVLIGMLVVYIAITGVMYLVNVAGFNGMFSLDRFVEGFTVDVFGQALLGNKNVKQIAEAASYVYIPFLIGLVYALFQGCCPAIGYSHPRIKRLFFALAYVAGAALYIFYLVRAISLFPSEYSESFKNSVTVTKWACYLFPLFYVVALTLAMNLTCSASAFILGLVHKANHKQMKPGFSIVAAIITFIVAVLCVAFARDFALLVVKLALIIAQAIISLISVLIGFAMLVILLSLVVPNAVVRKVSFGDGSYLITEEHGDKGSIGHYSKVKFVDKDGYVHDETGPNGIGYFEQEDIEKINNLVDEKTKDKE